ncbi:GWxTD domain-containing protein [Terriglobus roseus]|uniref:GWxTD domain-containing protein n=1 Tax=Terriglobus roseus TaxID=392734 RepID=A0A1H4MT04_9BACT|nr:GWxTD domain-containing protein [Terriglobus roseus]SEB85977.1 GWxTD domain-containing protein [Terriglobus roseus]
MYRLRSLLLILVALLLVSPSLHAVSVKNLPPVYRHWLTQEVNYIIESPEREEFLTLKTDAERDAFMKSFWDSRNPDPGSEINTYKEEHYKRLAYANEHFGNYEARDGWATDQGMIWITLGEPKQKITYPSRANVRPIIIWFYQSPTPALQSYFSVLFYKRSTGEDYALYSPYQDGPNRLITGLETGNDQARSLQQLRKALGSEVARTAVSLIPTEPVNLAEFSPSMMSDALLANIRGLADNPLEIARVNRNRREKVTSSIMSEDAPPEVKYAVIRDENGHATADMFVRLAHPDAGIAGARKAGGTGYDLTLQQHITTADGRAVYDTVSTIAAPLSPAALDVARHKVFAAEDQLPLEPGKYVVQTTLTNNINLQAHRVTSTVNIPVRGKTLAMGDPVAFAGRPGQIAGQRVPFTYAGVRFAPAGVGTISLHAGDPLQAVFQLWLPRNADGAWNKQPVAMHFYYGSALSGAKPLDEADETVDPSNADAGGNFVSGHTFHTEGLEPGNYRVIIRATQPGSPAAFGTMTLRVELTGVPTAGWSAYGPPEPQQEEMKRALSAEASGANDAAIAYLTKDLDLHPQNIRSLGRLATLLAEQHKVHETAQLVERPAFRDAVDMATLTLVSEALVTTGQPAQAMDLLNRQSRLQSLNAMLYTELAKLDDQAGKHSDGDVARKQAQAIGAKNISEK